MPFDGAILALDLAKKTGIAEGRPGETPRLYSQEFAKEHDEHEDIFRRALEWIANRLKVDIPARIVVEAPPSPGAVYGQSNADTTVVLIGLFANVSAAAKLKGVTFRKASVQTVRKYFIGHGNLRGEIAKRVVRERCRELGWVPANFDQSDAAAVWAWACHQVDPDNAPPAATRQWLDQVMHRLGFAR